MKHISILGSTGSIGEQTLSLVDLHPDKYQVVGLSAGLNLQKLRIQIEKYHPKVVSVATEEGAQELREAYPDLEIVFGEEGLNQVARFSEGDLVVSALVGARGIRPTLAAIEAGKDIALANKEVLVSAGEVVMKAIQKANVKLFPVDSEHSAIFQLIGFPRDEQKEEIRHITLTASGGPFLRVPVDQFSTLTPEQALKHPKWNMGNRITIDSATLMNKGFEVIEAKWLFDLSPSQIEVVIHPESILHGAVSFRDGNTLACLALPDMKAPIAYALSYPERVITEVCTLDFSKIGSLHFETPDFSKFGLLQKAYDVLRTGGVYPALLNAADEVAVEAFLMGQVRFDQIYEVIDKTLSVYQESFNCTLDGILAADEWSRGMTTRFIKQLSSKNGM